ncbi:hypothetical protein ACFLTN_04995 [Chloroflexota bacterium]
MRLKWYVIIAVVLALLSAMACSQRGGQPEQQFSYLCDKMKESIEQAQAVASDLEDFNWNEFSDVGILCPPKGICPVGSLPIVEKKSVTEETLERWVPLVERLPFSQTARTYSVQCASCLELANEVCSNSPYNGSKARMPEAEEVTLTQWQELCSQLQSALQGAEYLAFRDKTIAAEHTFPQLFAYFTDSDEAVKQKYLDKFIAEFDKYIKLQDELINNIQQAEQLASELANWQFSPQGPE